MHLRAGCRIIQPRTSGRPNSDIDSMPEAARTLNSATAKRREIPDRAKSQTARNPEQREIPNGDKMRHGVAASGIG